MIDLFLKNYDGIVKAFWETNYMMGISMVTVFVISMPLGILLFSLSKDYLLKNKALYEGLSISLNALRSIPFLIFVFILIPVNRFLFKTSFGNIAAILPLTLVGVSLYARFVEQALLNVPQKIIDRAIAYTTVMGVIGAGGLGEFAFRYGYQEYDYNLMYLIVLIFIIYVFIIQTIGYGLAKKFTGKKEK